LVASSIRKVAAVGLGVVGAYPAEIVSAFENPQIEVSPERANQLAVDGATFIDVREPYERDAGYIPGTRHIELERLPSQADQIDRAAPVVFHCRLGVRSAMAASAFRSAGFDAYTMAGGIQAWVDAGLPIEPEGGYVAEH
jgi:rhodanese-related sulfurtransferase